MSAATQSVTAAAEGTQTEADWLVRIGQARRQGNYLLVYDLAQRALQAWPDAIDFEHQAILALARAGATNNARTRYDRLVASGRLDAITDPRLAEDFAALDGRLWKDLAQRSRPDDALRYRLLSANAYAAASRRFSRYYTAINAASMFLAAGNGADATGYASAALELAQKAPDSDYWALATRAEALLILGEPVGAAAALRAAWVVSGQNFDEQATTRRQLAWVADLVGAPAETLQALAKPRVVTWMSRPDGVGPDDGAKLGSDQSVIAFGPVLSGADIITARALLDAGIEVNLVLPCDPELFATSPIRAEVTKFDEIFQPTIDDAASITLVTHEGGPFEPAARQLCREQASGLARLRAEHLAVTPELLAFSADGIRFSALPADFAVADPATGVPADLIRQPHAILFGDVRGFSKLNEAQQLLFLDHIIGGFADVLDAGNYAEYAETAGDGLFVIVSDVAKAAECCFALRDVLLPEKVAAAGLPDHLALRLSAHVGPLHRRYDRVIRRDKFCGMEVIRTARIEPVTPAGEIFVTEQFAATLACTAGDRYLCEYAGVLPMAKNFGECRMYSLRPATP
ncbi:MAG TPA: tetratricopeptide repeat-containing protein [Acetobacteraceae bacterium]|nr:tetratricopeptide repeat-containing protein [Acetobacteraceae bacterium]